MVKVKEFYDMRRENKTWSSASSQVNSFIEENDIKVIDVKYFISKCDNGFERSNMLLIYKEKGE